MTTSLISCTQAHCQVLAALHQACFEKSWSAAEFEKFLQPPVSMAFIVADDNAGNDPVGFILLRLVAGEAEILTIGVHPDHRRRNFGRALVNLAIDHCRSNGIVTVFLEVAEDNLGARRLYKKSGFESIDRQIRYYETETGRKDSLIYQKKIQKI